MENKKETMEAIMMGNVNNMRTVDSLKSEYKVFKMLSDYYTKIAKRNECIENAKAFWDSIDEERIESENAKVVNDTKKICEIEQLLDKMKKLIEEK